MTASFSFIEFVLCICFAYFGPMLFAAAAGTAETARNSGHRLFILKFVRFCSWFFALATAIAVLNLLTMEGQTAELATFIVTGVILTWRFRWVAKRIVASKTTQ